ncbi:MAG: hypothetical protein M3P08_12995 [Thermoproteota archaeon]|nr:hypothetical protein [Thermoproteota archaeon]
MNKSQDMQKIPFQSERPLLRIGSITFLTGLAIFIISSAFHAGREDPTNHLLVFAEYANSPPWIAAHIGQFVGDITIFVGGFVALFRMLVHSLLVFVLPPLRRPRQIVEIGYILSLYPLCSSPY